METKPAIGTRVILANGKHGTVISHPVKENNWDKVYVAKDGEAGCNYAVMSKWRSLKAE